MLFALLNPFFLPKSASERQVTVELVELIQLLPPASSCITFN
jgi:hypothetical protein